MDTFTPLGGSSNPPTTADIVARVDTQDAILDKLADDIAERISTQVDVQEMVLKPVYQALVRDIRRRLEEQAALISPVVRRIGTSVVGTTNTTAGMLDGVVNALEEAGVDVDATVQANTFLPNVTAPLLGPIVTNAGIAVDGVTPIGEVAEPAPGIAPLPAPLPALGEVILPAPAPIPVGVVTPPSPAPLPQQSIGVPVAPAPNPIGFANPVVPAPAPIPLANPVVIGGGDAAPTQVLPGVGVAPNGAASGVIPVAGAASGVIGEHIPAYGMNWCATFPCEEAEKYLNRLKKEHSTETADDTNPLDSFGGFVKYTASSLQISAAGYLKRFVPGNTVESLNAALGETYGRMIIGATTAQAILDDVEPAGLQRKQEAVTLMARIGAAQFVSGETGIPIDYLLEGEKYLLQYANPMYIPSQAEVDMCRLHNQISDSLWECWTKANGHIPACRDKVVLAQRKQADVMELISLWRRGVIRTKQQLQILASNVGVIQDGDLDRFIEATQNTPTASDLQHYNIRDAFDPNKLGLEEIKAEFEEIKDMRELYKAVGNGPFSIWDEKGVEKRYDPAYLDFVSSYEDASPTQTYQGMHRLRPGRVKMFSMTIPDKKPAELRTLLPGADIKPTLDGKGSIVTPSPVTLFEVAKNLKEHDYNPVWRIMLASTSFRVVGRIDLRRLYRKNLFGVAQGAKGFDIGADDSITPKGKAEIELVERYMDEGYNEIDSRYLAYYTAVEFDESKNGKQNAMALTKICQAYQLGVIDAKEAIERHIKISGDALAAQEFIDNCALDHQLKLVRATVSAIRGHFLRGEVDVAGVRKELNQARIDPVRIKELIDLWQMQQKLRSRDATARDIIEWYKEGQFDRQEAKKRIKNLSYNDSDADRMLKHADLGELAKSRKIQARIEEAVEKKRLRNLAMVQKADTDAQKAQQQALTKFLAFRSEKNLKAWWADGSITPDDIYRTLIQKGASDADARRWLSANDPTGGAKAGGAKE